MGSGNLAGACSAPPSVVPPFVQCDVGLNFPNSNGGGPVGLAPLLFGQILAADPADPATGGLHTFVDYPFPGCSPSYVSPNFHSSGNTYGGLAQGFDGKIYAICCAISNLNSVVEIDKSNGNVIRTLATGFVKALGITVDPMNGDLYVTDSGAQFVYRISNPGGCGTNCSATLFADLNSIGSGLAIDGLAWSPDTFSLLVAADATDQVILVDRTGKPTVFVNLPAGTHPDGIAFGLPGTPLGTPIPFAFTNNNNGSVTEINMKTKGFSTIASGGTRGDFVTVDDQGCLLATQTDRVTRLCTTNGGKWTMGGGGLCNNLRIAAAGVTSCNFCVTDPSVKAAITKLVKPICGSLACNPALAQKQLCTLISYLDANAPNCTGLLTAARTLRDQLSTVSPSPCPGA